MSTILVNSEVSDERRREELFSGRLFFYTPRKPVQALRDHAWDLICEAFAPIDPMMAQEHFPVEDFAARSGPLKTRFTHSQRTKELLRDLLADYGCDMELTYFDLARLRIVTHSGYLTAGVGYAYGAHRDVWYSAPPCQVNWWFPLVEIGNHSALAFHPQYWEQPVPNTSHAFDAYEWNANGRANAAKFITSDERNHPTNSTPIPLEPQDRIVGAPSSMLIFSAAQLHSTVPNTSARTRFSIDFRTASLRDLRAHRGANLVDTYSTGTTLRDFLRASDFSPLPDDVIAEYDKGSKYQGPLVYEPDLTGIGVNIHTKPESV